MSADKIRYKRLGYVALTVTDLVASRRFYEELLGLTVSDDQVEGALFLRCSSRHHDLILFEGREPGLRRIGWQLEDDASLEATRSHMQQLGIPLQNVSTDECTVLGIGTAFRIEVPVLRAVFEFYVTMLDAPAPFVPTHTDIIQLGHVVLKTPEQPVVEKWLQDNLNFRVSDRIEERTTFMRCFPNPFHHSLGVAHGVAPQFHHLNLMVSHLADIGRANNRMRSHGVPIVYGPGQHPPSESVFLYFLDPDRLTVEYSFGMEEFSEAEPRPARAMPPTIASIDHWGGTPEPAYAKVGVIEPLLPS